MPMAVSFRNRAGQILFLFLLSLLLMCIASGAAQVIYTPGGMALDFASLSHLRIGRANTLQALLQAQEFIVLAVTGGVLSLLLPVLSPIKASLLTLAATVPFPYLEYTKSDSAPMIPMEFSLLVILLLFAVDILICYFREIRVKQQIVTVFGQYIPPQLVAEISRSPAQLNLAGEAREMTVLFCDLQNFSSIAEQLDPRQLTTLLNDFFTDMTEVLYQYDATIDKYIGDSIMAFWGAPVKRDDHAHRAVLAALNMEKEMRLLSERFVQNGLPDLYMGIGINTGVMNVGNMGSKYRITYTVIGDAVNLAARMETLTRIYHVPCIVSESTRQAVDDVLFRPLDFVQVKGKRQKTRIYQPICPADEADQDLLDKLQLHEQGMECYFNGQSGQAENIFKQLADVDQDDGFYQAMLKRLI
jgi:adenylate cyclase